MIVYKHIIWDWNGTLLNDAEEAVGVVNRLLAGRGLPALTMERYYEIFDFPVIDFYRRIGFDFENETYDAMADEYIAGYVGRLAACHLQPGAREVLSALAGAGVSQSVLSAYHQRRLEEAVELFGLRHFFVRLIGLDDYYAHSKVENGRKWIAELGDPRQVLFIGDTSHDFEVANEMGVDCVLLTTGHMPRRRLAACGVPLFDTLGQIQAWLLNGTAGA